MVNSSTVSVTEVRLGAQQSGFVDIVSINETFNISVIIVDQISKIKLGNIQWGGFQWLASASLYSLPQYNSNGTLISTISSAIVIDTVSGTITATNLAISAVGMYVIKIKLISSNNQYAIESTSTGILVKKSTSKGRYSCVRCHAMII
jgi:hypothetical protein